MTFWLIQRTSAMPVISQFGSTKSILGLLRIWPLVSLYCWDDNLCPVTGLGYLSEKLLHGDTFTLTVTIIRFVSCLKSFNYIIDSSRELESRSKDSYLGHWTCTCGIWVLVDGNFSCTLSHPRNGRT